MKDDNFNQTTPTPPVVHYVGTGLFVFLSGIAWCSILFVILEKEFDFLQARDLISCRDRGGVKTYSEGTKLKVEKIWIHFPSLLQTYCIT